jgi:ubiquinone/menaquinone biosynthesis C-methylase UbiE
MKSIKATQNRTAVGNSYDAVAEEYAKHFLHELESKPFDRKMLDWLAERVPKGGTVCDLGCGPGQIARYLSEHGVDVCGIDVSPGMVKQARSLHPQIPFNTGDMLGLNQLADGAFGGIAAFYAIVNLPPASLPRAFSEMFRVLQPAGELLLAFHVGTEIHHRDEWWDQPVEIDFYFFESAEIKSMLTEAGFDVTEVMERDPYSDTEYPSRRAYVFARKPVVIPAGDDLK